MISQNIRALAPEQDPLRMGMGWTVDDLGKPQIMVESTFGDSHPGSAHLLTLVDAVALGVSEAGGKAARYFATDICDGMAARWNQLLSGQPRHHRQHDRNSRRSNAL